MAKEATNEVTVNVFNKMTNDETKELVGVKTFFIDKSVFSKSLGYLIGYIQCIHDNGLYTELDDNYWAIHGSYPPDDTDYDTELWSEVNI
jgi:hypothetical protein